MMTKPKDIQKKLYANKMQAAVEENKAKTPQPTTSVTMSAKSKRITKTLVSYTPAAVPLTPQQSFAPVQTNNPNTMMGNKESGDSDNVSVARHSI